MYFGTQTLQTLLANLSIPEVIIILIYYNLGSTSQMSSIIWAMHLLNPHGCTNFIFDHISFPIWGGVLCIKRVLKGA